MTERFDYGLDLRLHHQKSIHCKGINPESFLKLCFVALPTFFSVSPLECWEKDPGFGMLTAAIRETRVNTSLSGRLRRRARLLDQETRPSRRVNKDAEEQ